MIWYLRETFTAILCTNLPLTRPVFQRVFDYITCFRINTISGLYPTYASRPRSHARLQGTPENDERDSRANSPRDPLSNVNEEQVEQAKTTARLRILMTREVRVEIEPAKLESKRRYSEKSSRSDGGNDKSQREENTTIHADADRHSIVTREEDAFSMKSRSRSIITTCYHEYDEDRRDSEG